MQTRTNTPQNIQDILIKAGWDQETDGPFYPGKRIVKQCLVHGEYKSHCVVFDWREPDKVRIEVKAGITGRDLPIKELKKYPVSFQTPTFIEINVQ